MGLLISILRPDDFLKYGDMTLGGVSSNVANPLLKGLCVVNIAAPFTPSVEYPAVILANMAEKGPAYKTSLYIRPAMLATADDEAKGRTIWTDRHDGNQYVVAPGWHMFGSNFGTASDSRFGEACSRLHGSDFYGAVAIHDRKES